MLQDIFIKIRTIKILNIQDEMTKKCENVLAKRLKRNIEKAFRLGLKNGYPFTISILVYGIGLYYSINVIATQILDNCISDCKSGGQLFTAFFSFLISIRSSRNLFSLIKTIRSIRFILPPSMFMMISKSSKNLIYSYENDDFETALDYSVGSTNNIISPNSRGMFSTKSNGIFFPVKSEIDHQEALRSNDRHSSNNNDNINDNDYNGCNNNKNNNNNYDYNSDKNYYYDLNSSFAEKSKLSDVNNAERLLLPNLLALKLSTLSDPTAIFSRSSHKSTNDVSAHNSNNSNKGYLSNMEKKNNSSIGNESEKKVENISGKESKNTNWNEYENFKVNESQQGQNEYFKFINNSPIAGHFEQDYYNESFKKINNKDNSLKFSQKENENIKISNRKESFSGHTSHDMIDESSLASLSQKSFDSNYDNRNYNNSDNNNDSKNYYKNYNCNNNNNNHINNDNNSSNDNNNTSNNTSNISSNNTSDIISNNTGDIISNNTSNNTSNEDSHDINNYNKNNGNNNNNIINNNAIESSKISLKENDKITEKLSEKSWDQCQISQKNKTDEWNTITEDIIKNYAADRKTNIWSTENEMKSQYSRLANTPTEGRSRSNSDAPLFLPEKQQIRKFQATESSRSSRFNDLASVESSMEGIKSKIPFSPLFCFRGFFPRKVSDDMNRDDLTSFNEEEEIKNNYIRIQKRIRSFFMMYPFSLSFGLVGGGMVSDDI